MDFERTIDNEIEEFQSDIEENENQDDAESGAYDSESSFSDEDLTEEQRIFKAMGEMDTKFYEYSVKRMEQRNESEELRAYYSSFKKYPTAIKRRVFINLAVFLISTVLILISIFVLRVFDKSFAFAWLLIFAYTMSDVKRTFNYFKAGSFIKYRGVITEAHSKGIRNYRTYIIKVKKETGEHMYFEVVDGDSLFMNQDITLFIPKNAKVKNTKFGPTISNIIVIIPTEDLEQEAKVAEIKENTQKEELTAEEFFNIQ